MNKNRSNLVLSLLSLVITSFLLVFTIYSWYTSNQEVNTKGIVGATDIEHASFTLEKYNVSTTSWVPVTKIEEKNVLPGKVTYFRLKCNNETGATIVLNAKFEGITSSLDTNSVKISSDGLAVAYNGVSVYNIVSNKVTVNPIVSGTESKSVLYNINNSKISLSDFKVEDAYVVQCFGTTETKTGAIDNIDDATNALKKIDEAVIKNQTMPTGISYYYFALTFLDDDDVNNYYMYQELFIESFKITKNA